MSKQDTEEPNGDLTPVVKFEAPAMTTGITEVTRDPVKDLIEARNIRATIVNALGSQGIPTADPEMLNLMLKTLKDIDASALGQMRLTIEEKAADTAEQKKDLAAAALSLIFENKGSRMVAIGDVNEVVPSLDDEVNPNEFVAGEGEVGTVYDNFDSFQQRHGGVVLAESDEGDELA